MKNTPATKLHLPGRTDIIPRDPPTNDADTLMRECIEREAKQRADIAATPLRGCAEMRRRSTHFHGSDIRIGRALRIQGQPFREVDFHGSESTAI